MKPIRTKHTNLDLGAPIGWDEKHGKCRSMPVCRDAPLFYSWWRPSWLDRVRLLVGVPVRLCVYGRSHPPVSLDVTGK